MPSVMGGGFIEGWCSLWRVECVTAEGGFCCVAQGALAGRPCFDLAVERALLLKVLGKLAPCGDGRDLQGGLAGVDGLSGFLSRNIK
jgi:hypothetical protein